MSPDEFLSLPPAIALRILFDCLDVETVRAIEEKQKPKSPMRPKYDQVIYRAGGIMWASETDISGLTFWYQKASDGADSGGQYAAQDAKRRDSLGRWIAWREWYPDAVWSGERNNQEVVARAPSGKPTVYPRTNGHRPQPSTSHDDDINPDADVPF